MLPLFKKIPGFRSGKWWKALIASCGCLLLLVVLLAIIFPASPSLALEEIKPTNKSSFSIAGETSSGKPVYLLKDNEIVQSAKADSGGKFFFVLNGLAEGDHTYKVEACNSEKRDNCRSENIVVTVDQTPPLEPEIILPSILPDNGEEETIVKGVSEPNVKVIASIQGKELPLVTSDDKGEFEIKTSLALGANTISVKAIDAAGNESELSKASLNFNPSRYKVKVLRVVDGDTIKIEGDEVIRYIGIDAPETVHPSKPVQCYGKEASEKNRELVEGKEVFLEKDVSETDKYGRLLRYVWLGETLVNEYLAREGYAQASSYPPDVKYQDRFIEAQRLAREEGKGLWGEVCNLRPTLTPTPQLQKQPSASPTTAVKPVIKQAAPVPTTVSVQPTSVPLSFPNQKSGDYVCDCQKTCPQMSSCAEAQYQLNVCGCRARDGDDDGVACDTDCQ